MITQMCAATEAVRSAFLARLPAHDRPYVENDFSEHCPHAHLPATPVHDTADEDSDAAHKHWTHAASYSADGKLIAAAASTVSNDRDEAGNAPAAAPPCGGVLSVLAPATPAALNTGGTWRCPRASCS